MVAGGRVGDGENESPSKKKGCLVADRRKEGKTDKAVGGGVYKTEHGKKPVRKCSIREKPGSGGRCVPRCRPESIISHGIWGSRKKEKSSLNETALSGGFY